MSLAATGPDRDQVASSSSYLSAWDEAIRAVEGRWGRFSIDIGRSDQVKGEGGKEDSL